MTDWRGSVVVREIADERTGVRIWVVNVFFFLVEKLSWSCKIGTVMRYAKMKCNKRFIKVDSPNSQFILKLSASLNYSLSVNFFSEMFFFQREAFLLALFS